MSGTIWLMKLMKGVAVVVGGFLALGAIGQAFGGGGEEAASPPRVMSSPGAPTPADTADSDYEDDSDSDQESEYEDDSEYEGEDDLDTADDDSDDWDGEDEFDEDEADYDDDSDDAPSSKSEWWQQYSSCTQLKKNTAGHPKGPFSRKNPKEKDIYDWFAYGTGNRGDGDGDGLACE